MRVLVLVLVAACGKDAAVPDAAVVSPDARPAALVIAPAMHDFGFVNIPCMAAPTSFTVTNTGGTSSAPIATALGGPDPGEFLLVQDGCAGASLAPNAACTIEVGTAMLTLGAAAASLTATAATTAISAELFVAVHSSGLLIVSPSSLPFGTLAVGATSTAMTFTVSDEAMCPAIGTLSMTLAGSDPSQFSMTSDACSGTTLAGGQSCTVGVVFAPSAAGSYSATVDIVATNGGLVTVAFTGTALPTDGLVISPASVDFGHVFVGASSQAQTVTITNTGLPTGVLSRSAIGDAAKFNVTADTCSGTTLATNAHCTFRIAFSPTQIGTYDAQYVVSGSPGGSVAVAVHGDADSTFPLTITPTSHDFGSMNFDSCPGSPTSFTVENVGSIPRGPLVEAIGGTNASNFAITQDRCGGMTLMPNATCVIAVSFVPNASSIGPKAAGLQVNAGGVVVDAALSGVALGAAGLAASPCSLAFGTVAPGSTATQTFTVTNDGATTTTPIQVARSGSDAALFSTSGCVGQSLSNGQSCTVTVVFAPTAPGARTASVDVSASTGGTVSVMLTGD